MVKIDIFDILREAREPSIKQNRIRIVREETPDYTKNVDDENEDEDTEDGNTETQDYTQDIDDDSPEDEDAGDDTTDDTDTNETQDYTQDIGDDDTGDTGDGDTEDGGTDEVQDYTDSVDDMSDSDDATSTDSQTDEQPQEDTSNASPEEQENLKKNALLIKNAVTLFYSIKASINKIDKLSDLDITRNRINIQVKKNLTTLIDQLYDFITVKFIGKTYVENLCVYNYFLEAYKINVEMLRKNEQFET